MASDESFLARLHEFLRAQTSFFFSIETKTIAVVRAAVEQVTTSMSGAAVMGANPLRARIAGPRFVVDLEEGPSQRLAVGRG